MKIKYVFVFSLALFIVSISCRRELNERDNGGVTERVEDLNVPVNFNWDMKQSIQIKVSIENTKSYLPKSKISIYSANPDEGGKLYQSGSLAANKPFISNIVLPPYLTELFLKYENPFGSVEHTTVPIQNGMVQHTFSSMKNKRRNSQDHFKQTTDGPDCTEGCDEYISGGGTVNINQGKTYCVEDSFDGKINFENWNGGGTLRICGTATITNNQYLTEVSAIVVAEGGELITSKNIELSGAEITIYQNANVDIDDVSMGNNSSFTVYENADVEGKKFDVWGNNAEVLNYGNLTVRNNSYHTGSLENYGTLVYEKKLELNAAVLINTGLLSTGDKFQCYGWGATIDNDGTFEGDKDIEFGSNTVFTNYGDVIAHEDFSVYDNAVLENNGLIIIEKSVEVSSNGDFTNNCGIIAEEDISFSGNVKITLNTGFLKSGQEINFWNNKSIDIFDNCMISAEDLVMECDMNGEGALSSVVVTDDLNVWNNSDKFGGTIEVATTDGELNGGGAQNFTNGAYITSIENAVNYLPVTACNPDGFGTPTIVDMDFDGIPDTLDAYPDDPLRAFNAYFPDDQQYATVAFEDLWPSKGDYDFNDLVMAIEASYVTNAGDMVVDLKFNFSVLAVGASLDNGFGFQYESLTPDLFATVTGPVLEEGYVSLASNGLEDGQSKAVVIVTESINDVINRPGGSFFNTVPGNPQGTSDTINIVMTFQEPQDPALIDLAYFNPFIIKSKDRNVEIHLPEFPPTDLIDTDMFGTYDDASNPIAGVYYVTSTNLPWAMFLVEPFDYPVEKAQIIDAYNHFGAWAESGGSLYNDWYLNYSGYRNSDEIY